MANRLKFIEEKFNNYYDLYFADIYRFCMSKLNCNKEASEDCVQETFIVLLKNMNNGNQINNPRAFLYKTANNFILQKIDRQKKEKEHNVPLAIDDLEIADNSELTVDNKINFDEFEKKLDELLSDKEKELFKLRFIDDKKISDISLELNITPANCTVRISRLRQKIINNLNDFRL
nr:sigma-70 family RNA polymerase sigma factor [Eubacteriales bacterium]